MEISILKEAIARHAEFSPRRQERVEHGVHHLARSTIQNAERQVPENLKSSGDIESLCRPLENVLKQKCQDLSPLHPDWCMYKVPVKIRALNEKAYTPWIVSIGPYHHGVVNNQEDLKLRYLQKFLQWTEKSFMDLVEFAKEKEGKVRSYYDAETLGKFTGDAFAEMILLDAVFVVVLLLKWYDSTFWDRDDDLYRLTNLSQDLRRDLGLLENQLPLFILEELYGMVKTAKNGIISYSFLAASIIFWNGRILSLYEIPNENEIRWSACHFVDMLRLYHAPTDLRKQPKNVSDWGIVYPRSITELHEAGIRLKKSTTSTKFTEIRYENGILEIPHIAIGDGTESYLRNIVAFEQCHCIEDRYVIDYVSLMDRLVNTEKDVELLIENKILDNWLGDNNQVCLLFDNLNKNITFYFQDFYYASLCEDLDEYCKVHRHKWKASLRQNYFTNPWTSISVGAAIILLVLTILQTVASFMQVYGVK